MILPVVAYGSPVLRKVGEDITPAYPGLEKLIADMWDTLYNSNGVGLAAPQINKPIRLFIVDTDQIVKDFDDEDKAKYPNEKAIKQVFINAQMLEETGKMWPYNEGCLSIPKVREDIQRNSNIRIKYLDEQFREHEAEFHGITARVIQHEYDHIEGKLFIDYLSPLKKRLLKKKLDDISRGKISTEYRMIFNK
ncbi:peptide deformylase [Nemorincola caseinilytica]|uniref:Peptide deformylase n=1 Tax=Nemorincola caseinilytica TaxID=2054315 RepID=A0ABP8NN70_9BACT